jgi:hypothetical protein
MTPCAGRNDRPPREFTIIELLALNHLGEIRHEVSPLGIAKRRMFLPGPEARLGKRSPNERKVELNIRRLAPDPNPNTLLPIIVANDRVGQDNAACLPLRVPVRSYKSGRPRCAVRMDSATAWVLVIFTRWSFSVIS